MFEITDTYDGHSTMYYFDNPADSRDGGARMKVWNTPEILKLYVDTDIQTNTITFDYFPEFDTTATTEEITLRKENIAYCYPFNHDIGNDYTWVIYADDGWDMVRLLVDHNYYAVRDLLEPAVV